MEATQIILLAVTQGLTEFLPVSSSAHLILAPMVFGFRDQGLAFDVAVHLGSLVAVMVYFRQRATALFFAFLGQWTKTPTTATEDVRLANAIIVATLPVIIAGLLLKGAVETDLRSPLVIAWATIGFGMALFVADRWGRRTGKLDDLSLRHALIIGLFQALALIPGTSRSGITMTAALLLGYRRKDAAEFSFLLAIPTILMSVALTALDLVRDPARVDWFTLLGGTLLSFIAAYLCIRLFLALVERVGMTPFVIYRLLLGAFLLWVFA
jgi:undecaprenyl-diphosphatase